MSEQQPLKVTSARSLRGQESFVVQISQRLTVRLKRMDMLQMMMNGLIPLHLLSAAEKFKEMEATITDVTTRAKQEEAMGKFLTSQEDMAKTWDFMRHYATVVCLEPKLVLEDDGNPDHLPVSELTGEELMGIFNAAPLKEQVPLSSDEAQDFRRRTPDVPAAPAPAREVVQPTTKPLDAGTRNTIHA